MSPTNQIILKFDQDWIKILNLHSTLKVLNLNNEMEQIVYESDIKLG